VRTAVIRIRSESVAALVVHKLVADSQWFELEPYPDGEWQLRVKTEVEQRYTQFVNRLQRGAREGTPGQVLELFQQHWRGSEEELEAAIELLVDDLRSTLQLAGASQTVLDTLDDYVGNHYFS